VPTRFGKHSQIQIIHAAKLAKFPWLIHGFSNRAGGTSRLYGGSALNLGFTKDDSRAAVERNRAAFLGELVAVRNNDTAPMSPERIPRPASPYWPLVTLRQIHSDIIHLVDSVPRSPLVGDGLISCNPGLLLAIQTADCLPVILVDSKHHAVGVFHAGWRGTLRRIVEKGVGLMRRCFGTRAKDLYAAIGPSIHGCCYEVGKEVREKFESQFAYGAKLFREVKESDPVREKYPLLFLSARPPGHGGLPNKIFLDLVEANRQQLLAAGVALKNIEASPLCTNCRTDLLFSYRAEKGRTGRMMGVVGIRANYAEVRSQN
jgi:YfiH family protein